MKSVHRSVAEKRGAEVGHTVEVWWAEQSLHRDTVDRGRHRYPV